jgi:hypothetical protein
LGPPKCAGGIVLRRELSRTGEILRRPCEPSLAGQRKTVELAAKPLLEIIAVAVGVVLLAPLIAVLGRRHRISHRCRRPGLGRPGLRMLTFGVVSIQVPVSTSR